MSALVLDARGPLNVERAAAWLAQCHDIDEVHEVRDRARAIETYCRSRRAALSAQQDASEIALRAERRLGELCRDTVKRGSPKLDSRPGRRTLGEMGITRTQSSRWQQLAAVPRGLFESRITSIREKGWRLSVAGVVGREPSETSAVASEVARVLVEKHGIEWCRGLVAALMELGQ